MKRALLAASALAACAFAAPAFAAPANTPNWGGFYAGVNAGFGGDKFDYPASGSYAYSDTTVTGAGQASQTSSGFLGGGQLGYNYQAPAGWVVGAEADIDGTGIKGETALSGSLAGAYAGTGSASIKSNLDYLGTVRVRVGYPIADGRFMPYATGGVAFGQVKSSASVDIKSDSSTLFAFDASRTSTRTGWTAGVGADYAITDRVSFRAEYLYVDLGTNNLLKGQYDVGDGTLSAALGLKSTANIVRVAVNYRFGG
jgi:outer membrane immunogenic protein